MNTHIHMVRAQRPFRVGTVYGLTHTDGSGPFDSGPWNRECGGWHEQPNNRPLAVRGFHGQPCYPVIIIDQSTSVTCHMYYVCVSHDWGDWHDYDADVTP